MKKIDIVLLIISLYTGTMLARVTGRPGPNDGFGQGTRALSGPERSPKTPHAPMNRSPQAHQPITTQQPVAPSTDAPAFERPHMPSAEPTPQSSIAPVHYEQVVPMQTMQIPDPTAPEPETTFEQSPPLFLEDPREDLSSPTIIPSLKEDMFEQRHHMPDSARKPLRPDDMVIEPVDSDQGRMPDVDDSFRFDKQPRHIKIDQDMMLEDISISGIDDIDDQGTVSEIMVEQAIEDQDIADKIMIEQDREFDIDETDAIPKEVDTEEMDMLVDSTDEMDSPILEQDQVEPIQEFAEQQIEENPELAQDIEKVKKEWEKDPKKRKRWKKDWKKYSRYHRHKHFDAGTFFNYVFFAPWYLFPYDFYPIFYQDYPSYWIDYGWFSSPIYWNYGYAADIGLLDYVGSYNFDTAIDQLELRLDGLENEVLRALQTGRNGRAQQLPTEINEVVWLLNDLKRIILQDAPLDRDTKDWLARRIDTIKQKAHSLLGYFRKG